MTRGGAPRSSSRPGGAAVGWRIGDVVTDFGFPSLGCSFSPPDLLGGNAGPGPEPGVGWIRIRSASRRVGPDWDPTRIPRIRNRARIGTGGGIGGSTGSGPVESPDPAPATIAGTAGARGPPFQRRSRLCPVRGLPKGHDPLRTPRPTTSVAGPGVEGVKVTAVFRQRNRRAERRHSIQGRLNRSQRFECARSSGGRIWSASRAGRTGRHDREL